MSEEPQSNPEPDIPPESEPPVPQLADVPPEEWDYSNGQAFAGCGVVAAVVLAIVLPIALRLVMDSPWAQIIGFGVPGILAIVSVVIIAQMTRNKRMERRVSGTITETEETS